MLRTHSNFIRILSVFAVLSLFVSLSSAQRIAASWVSGGEEHSMILAENGRVFTCGSSTLGHSEDSTVFNLVLDGEMDTASGYLENIYDISAGWFHSLMLDSSGFVWAMGSNAYGQLGDPGTGSGTAYTPVQVHGGQMGTQFLQNIVAISAGRSGKHSLAVTSEGLCLAWGRDNMGQCGVNTFGGNYTEPQKVLGGTMGTQFLVGIIAVSAGEEHSMALTGDGFVYTWGDNAEYPYPYTKGKLGIGNTQDDKKLVPQKVKGVGGSGFLSNIVAISAGWDHCMALENYDFFEPANGVGKVYSWGNNGAGYASCQGGRLGDGTTTDRELCRYWFMTAQWPPQAVILRG